MTNVLSVSEQSRRIAERVDPTVASGVAVSDQRGNLAFHDMGQVMEFAKLMAVSDVAVPKFLRNNPGACLAVCIQALDWQLHPFQVANKSYSVNDRLAFESQLVQAVILARAPITGRFRAEYTGEGQRRRCKIIATLSDGTGTVDYESPELGQIKVKNSPLWTADPDQQLFYYSARALCRRHFPDVLLGVYTPEDPFFDDHRGPERAKQVAAPSSLGERFGGQAAAGAGFNVHHVDAETGDRHDAETGEITESAADDGAEAGTAAPAGDAGDETQAGQDGDEPADTETSSPAEPAKDRAAEKVRRGPATEFPGAEASKDELQAWARAVLVKAKADTLDDIWSDRIDPHRAEVFPADWKALLDIYEERKRALAR